MLKQLLLYNIKNADNVGFIYRLAHQYGVNTIYLYECAKPSATNVYKSEKRIGIQVLTHKSLDLLFQYCFSVKIALETDGAILKVYDYEDIQMNDGYLLVLGNESDGLPDDIVSRCDVVMRIPAPVALSYNVSHACAVALHNIEHRVVYGV